MAMVRQNYYFLLKELVFEYSAGCNYYQNGVIKAKPLYSGFIYQDDFWPYSVFQYDENKNEFVLTASVEEIPKVPENPDNFPEEYDKDGDGKVYIISQGESVKYLDEQEYLEWKRDRQKLRYGETETQSTSFFGG